MKKILFKGTYRPEIDGLRGFAVLAVIVNHFNKDILPSGYLGVDIFFVISGFVITSSLANRESKNFSDFASTGLSPLDLLSFFEEPLESIVLSIFCLVKSIFFLPLTESTIVKKEPFGPGTAPLIIIILLSLSIFKTRRFLKVFFTIMG